MKKKRKKKQNEENAGLNVANADEKGVMLVLKEISLSSWDSIDQFAMDLFQSHFRCSLDSKHNRLEY